jgi:DNA invertase Pin-like site-specific DNA recombinase
MSERSRGRGSNATGGSARPRALRCAIYTRVSTDQGLEQDFNSLDAQREACAAYIRSQAHEGWVLVANHYDDGGYTGGNLDRPALKALLEAVAAKRIDVLVVYKVDRLTRSLADFAKLVEAFDASGVSFISITQSFNTTTSMGRLTLNMLLSFAQFEREVTGERIRDKIAASKKRGIWVGGVVPLGYRVVKRKLVVDEPEAEAVRFIFRRYLEVGSLGSLIDDIRQKGIATRVRTLATGRVVGGVAFTRGPLAYLLKNRMYLGEINHGARSYPGEHPAIVDRAIFDAVQARLAAQAAASGYRRSSSDALLTGKLFDHLGRPMTPSHAVKADVRYRYYISRAANQSTSESGARIVRLPAGDVEGVVLNALVRSHTKAESGAIGALGSEPIAHEPLAGRSMSVANLVERIIVQPGAIEIELAEAATCGNGVKTLVVPWSKPSSHVQREIISPKLGSCEDSRAMSSDTRRRLLSNISTARRWMTDFAAGRIESIDVLAAREGRSARSVSMLLSLTFVAPDLVKAIVENRMPRGVGLTNLMDLPTLWGDQWSALELSA